MGYSAKSDPNNPEYDATVNSQQSHRIERTLPEWYRCLCNEWSTCLAIPHRLRVVAPTDVRTRQLPRLRRQVSEITQWLPRRRHQDPTPLHDLRCLCRHQTPFTPFRRTIAVSIHVVNAAPWRNALLSPESHSIACSPRPYGWLSSDQSCMCIHSNSTITDDSEQQ